MNRRTFALWLLLAIAPLVSCKDSTAPAVVDVSTLSYAPTLAVSFGSMTKATGGLWYQDNTVGSGAAVSGGRTVGIRYRAYLPDGTDVSALDATRDSLVINLASTSRPVLLGLSRALLGDGAQMPPMKIGGVRRVIFPPSLGYGSVPVPASTGTVAIPAGSTLIFDITLLSVE